MILSITNKLTYRRITMKFVSVKELPYDIFKSMLEDETISDATKTFLKKERGDRRYKVNSYEN